MWLPPLGRAKLQKTEGRKVTCPKTTAVGSLTHHPNPSFGERQTRNTAAAHMGQSSSP